MIDIIYYNNHKNEFDGAIHLCSRKRTVLRYNNEAMGKLKKCQTIFKVEAEDTHACGNNLGKKALISLLYLDKSKCGGITDNIELCIGARVMLRRNKDVLAGFVNGVMGTITGFE